jgi:hypothetical protein
MDYKETVRAWVHADNQLRLLGEKTRELREKKSELGASLAAFLTAKSMDSIPTTEGALRLVRRREYEHLTFKYLERWLPTLLSDSAEAELVLAMLKDKRQVKETTELVRGGHPIDRPRDQGI